MSATQLNVGTKDLRKESMRKATEIEKQLYALIQSESICEMSNEIKYEVLAHRIYLGERSKCYSCGTRRSLYPEIAVCCYSPLCIQQAHSQAQHEKTLDYM